MNNMPHQNPDLILHSVPPRIPNKHNCFAAQKPVETWWHYDAREGKWMGNWWMEWVASTLHTTSEHGVSSITTADRRPRLRVVDWTDAPCRIKWTRPFRRKTKSGFCECAITFQLTSNIRCHCRSKLYYTPLSVYAEMYEFPSVWRSYKITLNRHR